jgi:tryptophan-rich sensory protein
MKNIILWIFISTLSGAIGSFFTVSAIPTWYLQLQKPFFNPPNWIFGPVWSLLYGMMGIAMGLIASQKIKKKHVKKKVYQIFSVQLALNCLWSIIFFGLKTPLFALLEIILLWGAIFLTIKTFRPLNKWAAYLLLSYLAWVSFATLLNLMIVVLN